MRIHRLHWRHHAPFAPNLVERHIHEKQHVESDDMVPILTLIQKFAVVIASIWIAISSCKSDDFTAKPYPAVQSGGLDDLEAIGELNPTVGAILLQDALPTHIISIQ